MDSPVSGGRIGAEAGELTLMVSGDRRAYSICLDALQAIAKDIHYVDAEVGKGQDMKACLQGLVGCIYGGMFEVLALGAKAGLSAESLYKVIGSSVANTPIFQNTVPAIMARRFTGSGSTVYNTYKDLTITMALAQEHGVPRRGQCDLAQHRRRAWLVHSHLAGGRSPPGSANIPLKVGAIAFAVACLAAFAAWSARETYRIRMEDLGDKHATPVDADEYERIRIAASRK